MLWSLQTKMRYKAITQVKQHFGNDFRPFHSLGVGKDLHKQLINSNIHQPTPAQAIAIPHILKGKDVVIGAETGGGKTLAYLIPLLEQLRCLPHPIIQIHRPVALIMTTSQELVAQVMNVVSQISPETAKFTTALSSTNQSLPNRSCSLLIATPKSLLRAAKPSDFAFTEHIIVDEADMLLTGGFEHDTKQILARIRNQPLKKAQGNILSKLTEDPNDFSSDELSVMRRQTVFSAATIPDYGKRSVRDFLQYKFPDAVFVTTNDFHRTLPRIAVENYYLEEFASNSNLDHDFHRMELLWSVLSKSVTRHVVKPSNTLIFANSIESADALYSYLTNVKGLEETNCFIYHKDVAREERKRVLQHLQDSNRPQSLVVVCTDIAARGLDTTTVGHVIQYEFATDVVSYIHRIGRTARAGTNGRVSNLISKSNELVFQKIQEAGSHTLHSAFSRKRSLRKKVKKIQREAKRRVY